MEAAVMRRTAILLIDSPDRKGLVAAIADFLYRHDANILHADQHQDAERGAFLMRVEWDLADFDLDLARFPQEFGPLAERFSMRWRLERSATRHRLAIFVSRYTHCLADLLYRHDSGELDCDVALVVGNHDDGRRLTEFHGVPFHLIPVEEDRAAAERRQL